MGAVGAEDGFLVAFAEDEDEVTRLGAVEGELDGLLAVELFDEVAAESFTLFDGTIDETLGDCLGVFVAGIILGNND